MAAALLATASGAVTAVAAAAYFVVVVGGLGFFLVAGLSPRRPSRRGAALGSRRGRRGLGAAALHDRGRVLLLRLLQRRRVVATRRVGDASLAHHEDRAVGLVRYALGDAADRTRSAASSAADDQEVGCRRPRDEDVEWRAGLDLELLGGVRLQARLGEHHAAAVLGGDVACPAPGSRDDLPGGNRPPVVSSRSRRRHRRGRAGRIRPSLAPSRRAARARRGRSSSQSGARSRRRCPGSRRRLDFDRACPPRGGRLRLPRSARASPAPWVPA